jgi:hypothetical protein
MRSRSGIASAAIAASLVQNRQVELTESRRWYKKPATGVNPNRSCGNNRKLP